MRWNIARLVVCGGAAMLAWGASDLQAQSAAPARLRTGVALSTVGSLAQEPTSVERTPDDFDRGVWGRDVVRVGQDYTLRQGESVRDVMAVLSPAVIEGYVAGDVTVILGTVQISRSAVINGTLLVVGGNVTIQSGAAVRRDLVVIGGGLDAPPDFVAGHQHVAIGATAVADGIRRVVPWITEGLLLGRPIAPRLSWVWLIVGFFFLASLVLNLLFRDTVRQCADAIASRPLTTFLVGLLVLLLTGPVAVILAASVIGILVIPFVLCAVVVAWIIGKVGVSVRLGDSMVGQTGPASRLQSVRSLAIGFAAICLIYMVPVLGFVAWALVGVTGLGAAALAFASAYRRENPAPAKPSPPPAARQPDPIAHDPGMLPPLFSDDLPPPASLPNGAATVSYATTPGATNLLAFPKAGFFERAAAFALDTIFVLMVCGVLGLMDHDDSAGMVFMAMLAYHIGFLAWKGTTFGGIVCQLRVVRLDGSRLRFVDALVRGIASVFSLSVAGIGCFWILKDEERQAWHDKIAGTYVISVPRNWPLS